MTNPLDTKTFKSRRAGVVLDYLWKTPNYVFFSKITPYLISDSVIDLPSETEYDLSKLDAEMVLGKKIKQSDIARIVDKNMWISGTVYSPYSSTKNNSNHYVTVLDGSYYFTYKCLDNNDGSTSVNAPSGELLSSFELADGYVWKYLFKIQDTLFNKFSTVDYMPITADVTVYSAAVKGSIDNVNILSKGSAYLNYYEGTFTAANISYGTTSEFSLPASASPLIGFYEGCYLVMLSGAAAGEYRKISTYNIVSGSKVITLESPFINAPSDGDVFEISPAVNILGDGLETEIAEARAILDDNKFVKKIEILNSGSGYNTATASVYAHTSVNILDPADLSPAIAPGEGHGTNLENELNSTKLAVSVQINQSESGNVLATNDYRTIGIISKPEFSNFKICLDQTGQIGNFISTETVKQVKMLPLTGTVSVSNNSAVVTGYSTEFNESLESSKEVLITDGTKNWYSTVSLVANNTSLQLYSAPNWTANGCAIKLLTTVTEGKVKSSFNTHLIVDDIINVPSTVNRNLVGTISHTTSKINFANTSNFTIDTRGVNNFDTFNSIKRLDGQFVSTTFQQDEEITQGNNKGIVHSVVNTANTDIVDYVSVYGDFNTVSQITGSTSGAVFNPSNKYDRFLKKNSGEILYIQNVLPISRASNKSEKIVIVMEI